MTNALMHDVQTVESCSVETIAQLIGALQLASDETGDLDATYVVETLAERLSDGSYAHSIRIRLAQPV